MLTMGLTIEGAKSQFFDRSVVGRAVDKAKKRNLSMAGAFVRRRARQSMKKVRRKRLSEMDETERLVHRIRMGEYQRGERLRRPERPFKGADPGEPPRYRTRLLKDFIFFAFEPERETTVVGPVALNRPRPGSPDAETVPELLEFGGAFRRNGQRRFMEARPFMGPALEAELDNFAFLWRDSIRR